MHWGIGGNVGLVICVWDFFKTSKDTKRKINFLNRNSSEGVGLEALYPPLPVSTQLKLSWLLTGTRSGYLARIFADSTHLCSVNKTRN